MGNNRNQRRTPPKTRLDRETWLLRALEALAEEGPQVLAVEKLCSRLGVSRGSFYWHFKNRAEFVRDLVDYWDQRFTQAIRDTVAVHEGDAAERLMALTELIQQVKAARFDLAIRSWAGAEPEAAAAVKRTDETRYRFVRSLFAELGFQGDELEMRTRTYVVFSSMDDALGKPESPKGRVRRNKLRHRLLTSP